MQNRVVCMKANVQNPISLPLLKLGHFSMRVLFSFSVILNVMYNRQPQATWFLVRHNCTRIEI